MYAPKFLDCGCCSLTCVVPSLDTGGNAQGWILKLAQEMNLERGVKFSVFCLDYREYLLFYPREGVDISSLARRLQASRQISSTLRS